MSRLLYQQGYDLLAVGNIEKARAVLTTLIQLDPSEERGVYASAATYQMEGRFDIAAQIYTTFITMDATNSRWLPAARRVPGGAGRDGKRSRLLRNRARRSRARARLAGFASASPRKWAIHGAKQ